MRVDTALERLGGVASAADLLRYTSKGRVRHAFARGEIVRDARGRCSLPGVSDALRAASQLGGVLAEDSAAEFHGGTLKYPPTLPCVAVPRNRKVDEARRGGVRLRYRDVDEQDLCGRVTGPAATVMWSAARLPFDEALAIADCALRLRDVEPAELLRAAAAMPARYRARCLRVARAADGRAANPFESVLRAIALEVVGLTVEPQVWISGVGRPDLVDRDLRIVLEADSFEFHGGRAAFRKDCRRYNDLAVAGWLVLRFCWEDVMFRPDHVRQVLETAVGLRTRGRSA